MRAEILPNTSTVGDIKTFLLIEPYFYRTLSVLWTENFLFCRVYYGSQSRRPLVAFVLIISSVILAVFDGLSKLVAFFCCPHSRSFLEASRCFCLLYFCCFCRLSRKLFVGTTMELLLNDYCVTIMRLFHSAMGILF